MDVIIKDYNNASNIINNKYSGEWAEINDVLNKMRLQLKASDQAGKIGTAIFDPVGTNASIKTSLCALNWDANKAIPETYKFLGTDIDFVKSGMIVEVQFSNYPFLLNNLLRSELFYKAGTIFTNAATDLLVIVTKCHVLPASNSTLYYEQAQKQLDALSEHNVFDIPIRLVGLKSPYSESVPSLWTTYEDPRYSRTVILEESIDVKVKKGTAKKSRAIITR